MTEPSLEAPRLTRMLVQAWAAASSRVKLTVSRHAQRTTNGSCHHQYRSSTCRSSPWAGAPGVGLDQAGRYRE